MRYPYSAPSPCNTDALHKLLAGKSLPGYLGLAIEGSSLLALFASPLSSSDKAALDTAIASYAYQAPAPTPDWNGLLVWAAQNVPSDDLWKLEQSMYGTFLDRAARANDWGAPDGSGSGAASYYVALKADVAKNPGNYPSTAGSTLATIAAQFANFGIPITP